VWAVVEPPGVGAGSVGVVGGDPFVGGLSAGEREQVVVAVVYCTSSGAGALQAARSGQSAWAATPAGSSIQVWSMMLWSSKAS